MVKSQDMRPYIMPSDNKESNHRRSSCLSRSLGLEFCINIGGLIEAKDSILGLKEPRRVVYIVYDLATEINNF